MRLTVTTFVTMDDVMQSPGAPEEDPWDGFDLGGWLPPHFDEQTGHYMNEVFDQAERTEPFFRLGWAAQP
jgi:hypothetical protein